MISVLCLSELLQCFSSHETCVAGYHSFHRMFGWNSLHTSGSRQASNHDRTASVGLFSQDTRVCWSLLGDPSQGNIRATTAPRRRRSAEQLHGSFVSVKTHASSRLSGHRALVNFVAGSRHCFVCRWFFCVRHSTRTQFLHASAITDHRIHSLQAHPSQRSTAAAARHIFSASLGTPRADGARQVRLACAKPQTSREVDQDPEGGLTRQCNTRPSFLTMCCVWESLSQDDGLLLPQAARRASLVSSVETYLTNLPFPPK